MNNFHPVIRLLLFNPPKAANTVFIRTFRNIERHERAYVVRREWIRSTTHSGSYPIVVKLCDGFFL